MAVLAKWQRSIVDEQGNIVPNCNIEVRRQIAGMPLATLYSTRDGSGSPLGNPFQADSEGFAAFHVSGGPYKIRAYLGGFERIWDYVGIGTNSENDFGTTFVPKGAWNNAVTYSLGDVVSSVSGGDPYAFVSNENGNLNHAPPFSGTVGTSDTHWTVLGLIEVPGTPGSSDVTGTSATSLAIGTGAKVFTVVEADRGWAIGARLRASSSASPIANWMEGVVTAYADPSLTISVDLIGGSGTHADWIINLAGQQGQDGSDPGILLTWDTGTADADPGAGKIRANNASLAAATFLYVSKTNRAGSSIATFLLALDDSTTVADKGGITLTDPATDLQTNLRITSITDATGYVKVAVSGHSGQTAYANLLPISFEFSRTGDKGADGTGTVNSVNSIGPTAGNVALTASNVPNTPAGNIAATDVQAAINELDSEKQPLDSDLTALAGLGSNGIIARTGSGTVAARTITNGGGTVITNGDGVAGNPTIKTLMAIGIACSDETTNLTAGTGKATFRMPFAFTVTGVRATLTTAQASGSIFTVDINEAGVTILSTKLTIDNTEKTSTTAATPPVISDSSLADDAEITVDIDQVGTAGAKGLKIWLIGNPT